MSISFVAVRRSKHIQRFVQEIWQWYAQHKRMLPWRDLKDSDETERAYKVLVSEIMLQQTQVPRIKIVFKEFLKRFPHIADLASASNRDVLIAWRGMGYNSRALRLRDAARTVVEKFGGVFPSSMEALQSIKGIGHYTAAAIRNFAFGIPTPCLDTNIRRVLHRTFVGSEKPDGTWKRDDRYLLKLAEEVLQEALRFSGFPVQGLPFGPEGPQALSGRALLVQSLMVLQSRRQGLERLVSGLKTAEWHAALMDFGSLVQTKTNPHWDLCPLTKAGLMKAKPHHFNQQPSTKNYQRAAQARREPGRTVGRRFIPNRIFRGRIVEELRDRKRGLECTQLGKRVCPDWNSTRHMQWFRELLTKLEQEKIIEKQGQKYALSY